MTLVCLDGVNYAMLLLAFFVHEKYIIVQKEACIKGIVFDCI